MVEKLNSFTTIKYVTSDGEKCSATKNNGIVTIQGDKNGVRQVPYDKFMQDFLADQEKVNLERSPSRDTVSFSGTDTGAKLGPAGFGPGHPKYEDKSNKKAWIFAGLGTFVAGGLVYALTRGKVKPNNIAGLTDNAVQAVRPVADDITRASDDIIEVVAEEVAPKVTKPKIKPNVPTPPKAQVQPKVQTPPKAQVQPNVPTPPKAQVQPKETQRVVQDIGPDVVNSPAEQIFVPFTVNPKTEKIVENIADNVIDSGVKSQKGAAVVDDLSKGFKSSGLADDVTRVTDDIGYVADDAVDVTSRGMYGQDINDITDIRNFDDITSPYYRAQDPFRSPLDDMLDPYGFGSSSSYGFADPFNPFG